MKVVIIDDHKLIRKGIRELLLSNPEIEVCGEADNYESSMELLKNTEPDIAILDLRLGEQSGLDLILEKDSFFPNVKFLVYSMYHSPSIVKAAFDSGATGFVTKTAPEDELITAIKKIENGEIYKEKRLLNSIENLNNTFGFLTEREQTVFTKIQMHKTNVQIADELSVNLKTIENYIYRICDKTGLENRAAIERME